MGQCMSGTVSRGIAEGLLDQLQKDGLSKLGSERWGLNKWNSNTVYGYDFSRNKAFQSACTFLMEGIKQGYKDAKFPATSSTLAMEWYIQANLTHHVMKSLLAPAGTVPSVNFDEVKKDTLGLNYVIPTYNKDAIKAFQAKWTQVNPTTSLSIDTEVEREKNFLSAKLSLMVQSVMERIDVAGFVLAAIEQFERQKRLARVSEMGLFAGAGGAAGSALVASRAPYSEAEQRADIEGVIRKDLAAATTMRP